MKQLRIEIAGEAGFANFVEYAFRNRERFDYGIADSVRFHEAVEQVVVPLMRKIQEKHRLALGVRRSGRGTRPSTRWDGPRSYRFTDVEQLAAGTETIFRDVNPELGEQFALPAVEHSCSTWPTAKERHPAAIRRRLKTGGCPFIFMNAVGLDSDVRTLLHEGGHAFHTLACRGEPLSAYRESPLEFCEVASMTMELLGARTARPVLRPGRSRPVQPQAARGDRADPALDRHGRRVSALALQPPEPHPRRAQGRLARLARPVRRLGRLVRLRRRPRSFLASSAPYFLVSVLLHRIRDRPARCLADLAALSDRPAGAVADYKKALALGGSRPLPELFAAAGIRFDFSDRLIASLMDTIGGELAKLSP